MINFLNRLFGRETYLERIRREWHEPPATALTEEDLARFKLRQDIFRGIPAPSFVFTEDGMRPIEPTDLMRHMIEVTPLRVGHRVTIAPDAKFSGEWPGEYVIVGMTWEYQNGAGESINYAIASDDDIQHRHGSTDGWRTRDLVPAKR